MKLIKDFVVGDHINSQFVVGSVSKNTSMNMGQTYYTVELKDASGSISCKKWEVNDGDNELLVNGNVIEAELEINLYKESLQGKIINIWKILPEEIDVSRFVKKSPIPKEKLVEKFNKYLSKIEDKDYLNVVNRFIKDNEDKFFDYPAASSVHHEFSSGLLMHVTSMLEIADHLCDIYNDINKSLVLAGVILHDIGKIRELEGPISYHYTLEGKLIGHISIMSAEVVNICEELNIDKEKTILLQHMVLSHHGQLEFGSPVLPQTKEALLLSLVDKLDSAMTIADKALEDVTEGECSQKVYHLDNRTFYKPKK